MTSKPRRPRLDANPEPLVPAGVPAESVTEETETKTVTLSLRVPRAVYDQVQREVRRLHFELGAPKGAVATSLITVGLAHMDEIVADLSTE